MENVTAKSTKFYHYRQNNSGGSFDVDEQAGIDINVFVEAYSAGQADDQAERIGLYFDGVDKGMDCDCCGDRWYTSSEGDWSTFADSKAIKESPYVTSGYIHRLDGSFYKFQKESKKNGN